LYQQIWSGTLHPPSDQADIFKKQDEVRTVNACMSLQTCYYAFAMMQIISCLDSNSSTYFAVRSTA